MGLRVGLNLLKSVFGRNVQKTIKEVPKRMTRTMTDPSTGIVKMEREITYAGKEATATVEVFPNGVTKTSITGGGDNPIWRTKTITREKNASIFACIFFLCYLIFIRFLSRINITVKPITTTQDTTIKIIDTVFSGSVFVTWYEYKRLPLSVNNLML